MIKSYEKTQSRSDFVLWALAAGEGFEHSAESYHFASNYRPSLVST